MDSEIGSKLVSVTSELQFKSESSVNISEDFEKVVLEFASVQLGEFNEYHESLYDEEIQKLESYFEDIQELKRYEIDELQKEIDQLKKERNSLPFKAKKEVSSKIQKLKDKQAKLEDEISELRHKSRDEEKAKAKKLHDQGDVKQSLTLVFSGTFSIA